jgi:predicted nuclease with TOPRIM domain
MSDFSDLLTLSIRHYTDLTKRTREIGNRFNELTTEEILISLKDLNASLNEAKNIDSQINISTNRKIIEKYSKIHYERLAIMENFLELNNSVALKIKTKMAVVLAERDKIKNGRAGISGYLSGTEAPTRFVNESA